MPSSQHQIYPRSPIVEALLEIHFRFPAGKPWQASLPGALWKEIASEFPDIEPIVDAEFVGFSVDEHGVQPVAERRKRYRFVSKKKNIVIQLWESRIAISHLAPYPGWEKFEELSGRYLKKWISVSSPESVTRIGLRYINIIPKNVPEETVGNWLESSAYMASIILDASFDYMSRVQVRTADSTRAIVGVADHRGPGAGGILLDIDNIVEKSIDLDVSVLFEESRKLNLQALTIFKSFISKRLEDWMRSGEGEMQ